MKWTILEKPEEMRLDGKPIWVYAKHENGVVCYCTTEAKAERVIVGDLNLTYGWTTTEATTPTYRHYKRIPDVRGEKLRRKSDGIEFTVFGVSLDYITIRIGFADCTYTSKEAFNLLEYPDGTPFGEVEE